MSTSRRGLLGALLLCGLLSALAPARAAEPVRIGWTHWTDGVFVTRLAAHLIEHRLGREVELVEAPISEQYQAIAAGRIDVMMMSWQPTTHGPYLERVAGSVEHLGVLYDDARLGWAVPAYVPADAVAAIPDLAEHTARFDARVTGIDPAAGLTRLSRVALGRYGLDGFELETSSGPAMARALAEAVADREWIVVTAWNPHWIFARHDLRYLDDPENVLGGSERVHVLARAGFYADHPAVARLLARMYIDRDRLETALLDLTEAGETAAVERFIADNATAVAHWLGGER